VVPAIALVLAVGLVVACGSPAAAPTSAPAPAATATPAVIGTPTALPRDVENAYLSNVDDLIAGAADLAVTPCDQLIAMTNANPNLVPAVRGFATALKRVGTSQPALDTDAVRTSLADLDHSMGQFEGALSQCGIS
jgi:hypothetical protein